MKKIISILLSAIIITSMLTGCTNITKDIISKDDTSVNATNEDKKQDSNKVSYKEGVWEDKTYKNESINMSFTLPEDWVVISKEEAEELITKNIDDADKETAKKANIYEFLVKNEKTGSNAQLLVSDSSFAPKEEKMTAQQHAESIKNEFATLKDSGYMCTDVEDTTICNQQYKKCSVYIPQGVGFRSEYNIQKQGKHLVLFIVTYSTNNKADYENFMSSLKPIA